MDFVHFNFVGQSMTGPMMDIDLRALGREFRIPIYFVTDREGGPQSTLGRRIFI